MLVTRVHALLFMMMSPVRSEMLLHGAGVVQEQLDPDLVIMPPEHCPSTQTSIIKATRRAKTPANFIG